MKNTNKFFGKDNPKFSDRLWGLGTEDSLSNEFEDEIYEEYEDELDHDMEDTEENDYY